MKETGKKRSQELTEHFFRNEAGKMTAVITKFIGTGNVSTAEDIVQETLLKAVSDWQLNGIPENPKAWLYATARNLTLNILKRKKIELGYKTVLASKYEPTSVTDFLTFAPNEIADEQLRMMFICCQTSIAENTQVALILKILCGFSIAEIANAFLSNNETINKRLVRGRKQLRKKFDFDNQPTLNDRLPVVLRTIYLLFNEGYHPSRRDDLVRYDLCLEAIRLVKIIIESPLINDKSDCYALLALMYLNASRFDSRTNSTNTIVEMNDQNRKKWNQTLINRGIQCLNLATAGNRVSIYLILATISANHCIAPSMDKTNWNEILALYDSLLEFNDSPIIRLNRSVALSKVMGIPTAISELECLRSNSNLEQNHLLHSTLGELYKLDHKNNKAIEHFRIAIALTKNERDIKLLQKKLGTVVPDCEAQLS